VTTSDATLSPALRPRARLFDARFAKRLVILNGLVPMALLLWDALHGDLGVNDVNFAIRTTGLVGLTLILLTLAVTPLRRLTGWNLLIAVRRPLGVLAFVYLATHFAIFFAFDREASVASTVEEILQRTYLQIGTIALVLMIPLAVTSTDRMVSRLGARRWKLLHRLAYVIAILGVVHFLLLVKSDLRAPRAFAIVLGALLLFRLARHYLDLRAAQHKPAHGVGPSPRRRRFWSGELRVARIFRETPDVKTFRLVAPDGGSLPFEHQPGQYLNLALDIAGKRVNRSYTIASAPSRGDACEITVKRVAAGRASHHLHDAVREGDLLRVSAPAGRFVCSGRELDEVVLIAGGVGITPLMAMVRTLTDRAWPGTIHLVYGVRRRADVIFEEELGYLARRFPNLHVHVTLSDPDASWSGHRGRISEALLREVVPGIARSPVFLCGPDAMMQELGALLQTLGVPADRIATEAFVSPPTGGEAAPDPDRVPEPMNTAAREASAGPVTVRFEQSQRSVEVPRDLTLLEAAEDIGLSLPYECRSGICGQCKTRLLSGEVRMEVEDALSPSDRERGLVLACQARAREAVTVVAVDA
jgi:ferredoxin-NADP reductase/DMSO/TMAO reductase YedYZ heme-binding membrane subunit